MVFARSFARIHRGNLINFGILPLVCGPETEAVLKDAAPDGDEAGIDTGFSEREGEILLAGGIVNLRRASA